MKTVFAPGCALLIYKPELAEKILGVLTETYPELKMHTTCCHHKPDLPEHTEVINICPGCDKRYGSLYKNISTVSLWEVMDKMDFSLPDYGGKEISILDACPTRTESRVHNSIRNLMSKMNIRITEPAETRNSSKCCGDTFHGRIPKEQLIEKMKERANEMPCDEVAVYCISCVKSMKNGGKTPLYVPDLLFDEKTIPGECDPDIWHSQLNDFIEKH